MWYVIVLAGGSGTRMGAGKNKVLLDLAGESVLHRSVRAFQPYVHGTIVVTRPEDEAIVRGDLEDLSGIQYAYGGDTRQASVANGLKMLPADCSHVMIHDGARCLVDADTILRSMASAERKGSGIAAVPVTDTIKRVDEEEQVAKTPERAWLRAIQTPQAFDVSLIRQAHEKAQADHYLGTDDASLLEHMGIPVWLTLGSRSNIKLTTPEDLLMAEALLNKRPVLRVGQGYDVHRLVEDRKLILCGVEIPHTLGLLGHSDADVALHALMDAMLGATALGDIGRHFPDTDEQYRGISSMKLLEHVVQLLADHHAKVTNCDVTIVAQKPKLLPYVPAMRQNVAETLGLPVERVNIKATTTEKLGFEGQQEGISAQAICMVEEIC